MELFILGSTGNIGSCVRDEALFRAHSVTGATRDTAKLESREGLTPLQIDIADGDGLANAMAGHDAVIVSVKWNENKIADVVDAVRKSGVPRALFVVGAGSLKREDGRLHFDHMTEAGAVPPTSKPAMEALDYLRGVDDIEWAAISPPAQIMPGNRTGQFVLGRDDMPRPTEGNHLARISREDFAVAILDEIEKPSVSRQRITAAN